jgi:hypothetical protein
MKSVYLTIDFDFWSDAQVDIDFVERAIQCVPRSSVAAAVQHDSILAHLQRFDSTCSQLVNLDHHSDVGGDIFHYTESLNGKSSRRLALHSGSWVDYTTFRDSQEYVWLYPRPSCRTECRCDHFTRRGARFSQAGRGYGIAWRKLRHHLTKPPNYAVRLSKVRAVSIVLSPDFCGPDAFAVFVSLVRKYEIELIDWLPENLTVEALYRDNQERDRKKREALDLTSSMSQTSMNPLTEAELLDYETLYEKWMASNGTGAELLAVEEVRRFSQLAERLNYRKTP